MTKKLNLTKTSLFLIAFFILSRLIILKFPPPHFTEIIYSYMPYAHLWASGVKPYLDQWYEYPPATIPLFYVPHLIDMATLNYPWHLDYREAYKLLLFIVDVSVFSIIWRVLKKFKVSKNVFITSILFYIATTLKAHHFIYDTMDLVFALAVVLGVTAPILLKNKCKKFWSWVGFFLATALKYINAPLGLLYLLIDLDKKDFNKKIAKSGIIIATAFGVVWGLPLLLYRSSLQVSFLYHRLRGLQVDSAGATVSRVINTFTHSENIVELYKNYEITGPVSSNILGFLEIFFPLSIILYLVWGVIKIFKLNFNSKKNTQKNKNLMRIHLTLGYIFLFMITGKVLSRPFLLWSIPILALYPFKNIKTQLRFFIPYSLIIFTSMTAIKNTPVGIIDTAIIVSLIRTIGFIYLFFNWTKLKTTN